MSSVSCLFGLVCAVDSDLTDMREDVAESSASDAASSHFYSSPENNGDSHNATQRESDADSAEELEMPTEDEEEISTEAIGSSTSTSRPFEPLAPSIPPGLSGNEPLSSSGRPGLAGNQGNGGTALHLERKRKREFDARMISTNSNMETDSTRHYDRGSSDVLALPVSEDALNHQAEGFLETNSGRKRAKVSQSKADEHSRSGVIDTTAIMPPAKSQLPLEIWQHIFTFVPPVSLGRLLRVNKALNTALTGGSSQSPVADVQCSGVLKQEEAEAIWLASRKRFCPGLPRPLRGLKELDMWQLIRGRKCQFCQKIDSSRRPSNATDPWEAGPGENGVRVIWACAVRCCGPCLQEHCEKVGLLETPTTDKL